MATLTQGDVRELAEWRPSLGVVSVYLRFDPGDRGGAWRTALRNGLADLHRQSDELDHERRMALRATAERIEERFANHDRNLPRGEAGFVEVGAEPAGERWWSTHLTTAAPPVASYGERARVAPLVGLVGREQPRGVALVSAERVRLHEWRPGSLEQLRAWELSVFAKDWRERRAQRVPDPASAQAVSSSGREHYGDRLADNRHRFLGECRALALELGAERAWPELLALGPPQHLECFMEEAETASPPLHAGGEVDLISAPQGEVEAHVADSVERLAVEREAELAERAIERGSGGERGSAGPDETLVALREARVERLVLDADLLTDGAADNGSAEQMVRMALEGGASVTALQGEAAERLAAAGGVAALLRY
jgi:Bacterial archaeo-eukaryotic release factor family 10